MTAVNSSVAPSTVNGIVVVVVVGGRVVVVDVVDVVDVVVEEVVVVGSAEPLHEATRRAMARNR